MHGNGLWGSLIKAKYFRGLDSIYWIREGAKVKGGASIIWRSLAKNFPYIANDLSWKVGRGIQIQLGIDPICILKGQATLTREQFIFFEGCPERIMG